MSIICTNCKAPISEDFIFCCNCGAKLDQNNVKENYYRTLIMYR